MTQLDFSSQRPESPKFVDSIFKISFSINLRHLYKFTSKRFNFLFRCRAVCNCMYQRFFSVYGTQSNFPELGWVPCWRFIIIIAIGMYAKANGEEAMMMGILSFVFLTRLFLKKLLSFHLWLKRQDGGGGETHELIPDKQSPVQGGTVWNRNEGVLLLRHH